MNSTIKTDDIMRYYHTFTNVEFSGVFDNYKINGYVYNYHHGYTYNYHLFIKYGDKVYMDVKGIGSIVILFAELQKNKYWKYYYDISLLLTNDKHLIVQNNKMIYDERKVWSIKSGVYIDDGFGIHTKIVPYHKDTCYYNINPYDLENMEYTSQQDLNIYNLTYMARYETSKIIFEKKKLVYSVLAIDYQASLIGKEIDEITAILEKKKNIINLAVFNDMKGMNNDILMIIYNKLVSNDGNEKYKEIMTELGTRNRLESIAHIIAV
jgi:hypothetical protein